MNLSVRHASAEALVVFILEINKIIVEQVIDLVAVVDAWVVVNRQQIQVAIDCRIRCPDVPFINPRPVLAFQIHL